MIKTKIRKDIFDYRKSISRKEKSKFFTKEFFEKFPMKYRNLLEDYKTIYFKRDFGYVGYDFEENNLAGKIVFSGAMFDGLWKNSKNANEEFKEEMLLSIQYDIEEFCDLSENEDEDFNRLKILSENIEKEKNFDKINAFIKILKNFCDKKLNGISEILLNIAEKYRIYPFFSGNETAEKLSLILNIQKIIELYEKNILFDFISFWVSSSDYEDDHKNYLFINKNNGRIYNVELKRENTLYEIADNFDKFIDGMKIQKYTIQKADVYFPSNLHIHTNYSDGKNTIEEYILEAIENNFHSIGFSDNFQVPFDIKNDMSEADLKKYLSDIKILKEKYKDVIEIYIGLEADFYSGLNLETDEKTGLDYRIGTVRYIKSKAENKYYAIDKSEESFEYAVNEYGKNVQNLVEAYYDNVVEMVKTQKPVILGCFDLIKKYNAGNKFFDEDSEWYKNKVDYVLDEIMKTETIIEVNTCGIGKDGIGQPYPSFSILEKIFEKNIPVTLSTNAHNINELDTGYVEIIKELENIGFQKIKILSGGKFEDTKTYMTAFVD